MPSNSIRTFTDDAMHEPTPTSIPARRPHAAGPAHRGRRARIVGYQLAQAAIVTDQVFEERVGRAGGLRPVEFTILALVQGNPA